MARRRFGRAKIRTEGRNAKFGSKSCLAAVGADAPGGISPQSRGDTKDFLSVIKIVTLVPSDSRTYPDSLQTAEPGRRKRRRGLCTTLDVSLRVKRFYKFQFR